MTINSHRCRKLIWKCSGLGMSLGLGLALAGCGSSSEVESAPPTAAEVKAARATVTVTPAPQFFEVRYRVTGIAGQLTGKYTGASGADVPISGATPGATWETTASLTTATMRSQGVNLSAQTDSGSSLTIEIWVNSQLVGTQAGAHPSLSVRKH